MRIFLLTQRDSFYIPPLLQRFFELMPEGAEVTGAAVLEGEISAGNIRKYIDFMGPKAFVVQSVHYLKHRLLNLVDRWWGLERSHSVEGALRRHQIPIYEFAGLDDRGFLERLWSEEIDLVISIACPDIIPPTVLELPSHGCINLHGGALPKYRGLLPSFWVLAEGKDQTAVTVHVMNEKLDDGPIVVQEPVPIKRDDTLHSLILRSKVKYGAEALAEAVEHIRDGDVQLQDNPEAEATYYSFPGKEARKEFLRRGWRFR